MEDKSFSSIVIMGGRMDANGFSVIFRTNDYIRITVTMDVSSCERTTKPCQIFVIAIIDPICVGWGSVRTQPRGGAIPDEYSAGIVPIIRVGVSIIARRSNDNIRITVAVNVASRDRITESSVVAIGFCGPDQRPAFLVKENSSFVRIAVIVEWSTKNDPEIHLIYQS